MLRALSALVLLGLPAFAGVAGCAKTLPVRPPGLPPTPKSVTLENPGGDAADPELAALERLAKEQWGWKHDRYNTLRVPLIDWPYWQQSTLWGHPTRAAYRFGDNHYGALALWYTPVEGKNDPDTCLAKFLADATPVAEAYGIRVGETKVVRTIERMSGEKRPVVIKIMDGSIESIFETNDYLGAIAAYTSWPGTCLVQGFAVIATLHRDLAVKIRERWVNEGFGGLRWEKTLTEAPPTTAR